VALIPAEFDFPGSPGRQRDTATTPGLWLGGTPQGTYDWPSQRPDLPLTK
jgi:hypothetical protein